MLSASEWYKAVPKEREDNLRFRDRLLARCTDPSTRKAVVQACKEDLLFYVNACVWTYDPRTQSKSLPFITYPFQDRAFLEILECIETGRDLVIEKSRDMGASWMSLTAMEWLWHFHSGHSFLMVSRKEDLVDAPGDPDSLFWKLDFIHRHLPGWLRPDIDRRKLHFGNLDLGSTIDGESTTAAAGVGGRRTAVFIDEFSRIEEGYQLLAGTADTTNCRIFNFTPYGTSNAAYKLARRADVRKLRLHWSEHPEKARGLYQYDDKHGRVMSLDPTFQHPPDYQFILDGKTRSPWYDGECRRRANDREVAQMLDIDYQGSSYQFFDKSLIADLQRTYACPAYWEGDIPYDKDTGKPQGLIKSQGGALKLWCHPDKDGRPMPSSYCAGADIAAGTGATNSCLTVTDARTGEKVLEYANPFVKPEVFAALCVAVCWLFKDGEGEPALFAWEMQGPGVMFGKTVVQLGFRRIYYRQQEQRPFGKIDLETPGWYPSPDNKRVLLEEYRTALSTRQCLNRSHQALEECLSFQFTNRGAVEHAGDSDNYDGTTGRQDPSGAGVNHGDRVVADALAWKMCLSVGKGVKEKAKDKVPLLSLAWRRERSENQRRDEEVWI